jgi:hypothetical protein
LEVLHASSDFATIPATHHTPDTQDVSFQDRIYNAESTKFSSKFATLATAGFEPAELRLAHYIIERKNVIHDGPGDLFDQVIILIKNNKDVQQVIIDSGLLESLKQAEKFSKVCELNECSAADVIELEAAEPVHGLNKELVAAHQAIDKLEEELQMEKHQSARLECGQEKCKFELEHTANHTANHTVNHTTVAQRRLENDMLLHQGKVLSPKKSELESELQAVECVIPRHTTDYVNATPAPNHSLEPTPTSSENHSFLELTPGL